MAEVGLADSDVDGGQGGVRTGAEAPQDQGFSLDWKAALLSAEHRDDPSIKTFKDVDSLAKSYISARKQLGSSIRIPGESAPQEEWASFYAKLGRPKDATGYEYKDEHLPEGVKLHGDFEKRLRELSHEYGLSNKQFQGLVGLSGQIVREADNMRSGQEEQERVDGVKELQRMFGPSANRMRQEATAFFEMLGRGLFSDGDTGPKLAQAIAESNLARNPAFIATFSKAFRQMGEGDLLESELGDTTLMARDTLESERASLLEKKMNDPNKWSDAEEQRLRRIYSQLDHMGSRRRVA
jgi:hypothetical protein